MEIYWAEVRKPWTLPHEAMRETAAGFVRRSFLCEGLTALPRG